MPVKHKSKKPFIKKNIKKQENEKESDEDVILTSSVSELPDDKIEECKSETNTYTNIVFEVKKNDDEEVKPTIDSISSTTEFSALPKEKSGKLLELSIESTNKYEDKDNLNAIDDFSSFGVLTQSDICKIEATQ